MEWRASNGNKSAGQEIQEETADTFCSVDQLDSNIRFQLLRRRADEIKPFGHLTMVPTRPEEIPNHLTQVFNLFRQAGHELEKPRHCKLLNRY